MKTRWVFTAVVVFMSLVVCTEGDLVVHYEFGDDLLDSSSNAFHADGHGDIGFGSGPAGFGRALVLDNGAYDSGTNYPAPQQYLQCGPGPSGLIGENLTIAFWMKVEAFASPQRDAILTTLGHGGRWAIYRDNVNGRLAVDIRGDSGTGSMSGGSVVDDSLWHHYAMVVDTSSSLTTLSTYVDGRLLGGGGTNRMGSFGSSAPLWIGGEFGSERFATAMLDDIRIYNEALSGEQIETLTVPEPLTLAFVAVGAVMLRRRGSAG